MSETNERSVASAGSVAWVSAGDQGLPHVTRNDDGSVSLVWSTDKQTVLSISRELLEHMVGEINDARRSALTDAERDVIEWCQQSCSRARTPQGDRLAATLRGLLERMK